MILLIVLVIIILVLNYPCRENYSDYLGKKIANISNRGSYFYDLSTFQKNKTDLEVAGDDRDGRLYKDRQKFVQKKREIRNKGYNPISRKQRLNELKRQKYYVPDI